MINLDEKIFWALNNLAGQTAFSDRVFIFLAQYLPYLVALTLLILWLSWKIGFFKKIKIAMVFLATSAIAYGAVFLVFHKIWPRLRPFDGLLNVNRLIGESGLSFPSKHAVIFFLIATFVFGFNKKIGWWLFSMAFLIGVSRIVVGVHYPIDILTGAVFGILMGWVGVVLAKRWLR